MRLISEKATLSGAAAMPASKSHTIRALAFATLAEGESEIIHPLDSADTRACVRTCQALGAQVRADHDSWKVQGTGGRIGAAEDVIDVMNSGTTLYIALGMAALADATNVFTGDEQTRRRSAEPLLRALRDLGAYTESTRNNGCAPIIVRGPMRGGNTSIACHTSQYLTSLLISTPLAPRDTHIEVTLLNEEPYVHMTLEWLNRLGIEYSHERLRQFDIPGRQRYHAFSERMKGDFSSATFFLCAAAITGSTLILEGLDVNDAQGDKAVAGMLARMGAEVETVPAGLRIRGRSLRGTDLDLNSTPDALPALAVAGCFAEGVTRLLNVPQARMKETDRISVMREVIESLGGAAEELPDGLVIRGTGLRGGFARGHGDHRVVMACAVAGLAADRPVEVDTAEAVSVTFPNFVELMNSVGARMRLIQ